MQPTDYDTKLVISDCKEIIIDLIRNFLKYRINPKGLAALSKALDALSNYPQKVIDGYIDITSIVRFGGESNYCSMYISSRKIELSTGGTVYEENVGSDHFSDLFYSTSESTQHDVELEIYNWIDAFNCYLVDEDGKLSIEDEADFIDEDFYETEEDLIFNKIIIYLFLGFIMDYSITLPTNELKDAVSHLHKLLSKVKPKPSYPILDVIVKLDSIELHLVGMSRTLKILNKNIFSFTIPFNEMYYIALGETSTEISMKVSNGAIQAGNRECTSDHIKLIHPENLTPIDLPMNTSALDILSLRHKHSSEELQQNNYLELVEKYEEKIPSNVYAALEFLSKYGITKNELSKMIDKKIKEHSLK